MAALQLLQKWLQTNDVTLTPCNYREFGPRGLCTAPAGSHIVVRAVRSWHHAIYLGDSKAAQMHPNGDVRIVPLDHFMSSTVCCAGIVEYHGDDDALRNITCILAFQAAADEVGSNCECFATWARTGAYVSHPGLSALLPKEMAA